MWAVDVSDSSSFLLSALGLCNHRIGFASVEAGSRRLTSFTLDFFWVRCHLFLVSRYHCPLGAFCPDNSCRLPKTRRGNRLGPAVKEGLGLSHPSAATYIRNSGIWCHEQIASHRLNREQEEKETKFCIRIFVVAHLVAAVQQHMVPDIFRTCPTILIASRV
jgi:hypothetical protein